MLDMAARRSDEAEVSAARCTLTRLYFREYVPAATRAQAGATPIFDVPTNNKRGNARKLSGGEHCRRPRARSAHAFALRRRARSARR